MAEKNHVSKFCEFGTNLGQPEQVETPTHSRRIGRELAMQYLFQRDLRGNDEMPPFEEFFAQTIAALEIKSNRYTRKGCEYAEKILTGLMINQPEIDEILRNYCRQWSLERMSGVDKNILRVAIHEMVFEQNVPPLVSINEAIAIARDFSGTQSGNFINGVLNSVMVNEINRKKGE